MIDQTMILEKISDEKGFISIHEAEKHGVSRFKLSYLANQNKIQRVKHGVYALYEEMTDDYALLQQRSDKVIYSYHTALQENS
ncbi:type IV toxin-antitoxin system AbiEi family antitoxin domain-containing protein [Staphylococcus ursi]|uniref:type IV toxin-antitoxin system AbiEi family antitoxin domain-containing protein n=1 Tax=Staphylococcus sp. MI 10-1553 TaxID=1912064 RepID=UPI0013990937|nr:type IV toxin-antitoxin system AbiEi family antitoxin domain-containing protein [Staphylococcus sp. MI 10-1553]QHW37266.1 type IV toxin-antitoxin system AbiEi family antitoxin domain-containing protein [Staphylococcus sp. MI 10-1553]